MQKALNEEAMLESRGQMTTKKWLKKWLNIAKFWSFPINLVPIAVGSALAISSFNAWFFLLMVVGVISLNALANILNDVFDFRHGVDKADDIAVIKRKHPLVTGEETEVRLLVASLIFFIIAIVCGIILLQARGYLVIVFGLIGALIALIYTGGKHSLKSMGLGELAVFAIYGPLVTVAAYFVQSGTFSIDALIASIPVGIAIAAILLANNIRDINADNNAGLKTIAVRIGETRAKKLFNLSITSLYLFVSVFSVLGMLPIASLLAFATLPLALQTLKKLGGNAHMPHNSAELTSKFAVVFGIVFSAGIALSALI